MSRRSTGKFPCWRKLPKSEYSAAEVYLAKREKFCVAASARFLRFRESGDHVWQLSAEDESSASLIIHSGRTLFPVFGQNARIPAPRFLNRFLGKVPIHSIQGLRKDCELLESLMQNQGYSAAEQIDYDLMSLDGTPADEAFRAGPGGLSLRSPLPEDGEILFALQSAYEKEEVLPANVPFNPAAARLNLGRLLSREQFLVAEIDGQMVGKINTSAQSFTRYQIGGVYVLPACRGRGIAAKMTAVFSRKLLAQGKNLTLFVKKQNTAARKAYLKAGFSFLEDYRIAYY